MALKAPQGGNKEFVAQANIEPDVYPARVVQIIDFGLQPQKPYQGQEKKPVNEIGLTYELVTEFMKDEEGNDIEDKPRWISETLPFYGLFADKAKSTKRYNVLDPDGVHDGDFAKLIDIPCNVTVVNNKSGDKVYDNVGNVATMSPKKAMQCPELKNKPKVFDLDAPDMEVFNAFPKWIQDKLKSNLNYQGSPLQKALEGKVQQPKADAPKFDKNPPKQQEEDDNNPY